MITLNVDTRLQRLFNFIRPIIYDNSPFISACRVFNIASRSIDPTLARYQFRTELLRLPDSFFGEWIAL